MRPNRLSIIAIVVLLLGAVQVLAQTASPPVPTPRPTLVRTLAQSIADWEAAANQVESRLGEDELAEADLLALRQRLEQVRAEADAERVAARRAADDAQGLLAALGPAPDANAAPEGQAVAEQRRKLTQDVAAAVDAGRQTDFVLAKVQTLIDRVDRDTQRKRAESLRHRGPSLLAVDTWVGAYDQVNEFAGDLSRITTEWWTKLHLQGPSRTPIWLIPVVAWVAAILAAILAGGLRRKFGRDPAIARPTYLARVVATLIEFLAWIVFPIAIIAAAVVQLHTQQILFGNFGHLVDAVAIGICEGLLLYGMVRVVLAPKSPQWRLFPLARDAIDPLMGWVKIEAALTMFGELVLGLRDYGGGIDPDFGAVIALVIFAIWATVQYGLSNPNLWRIEQADPQFGEDEPPIVPPSRSWRFGLMLMRYAALATPIAIVFGYYSLTEFMLTATIWTVLIAGLYVVTRHVFHTAIGHFFSSLRPSMVQLRERLAIGSTDYGMLKLTAGWLFEIVAFLLTAVGILLVWGAPWPVIADRARMLIQGVEVGGISVSLVDIVLALAVLVGAILLTESFKRWLRNRVLPETRLDTGVRDSIVAGAGYVGYAIAILVAVSAAGINLANVAIIAGALSVGIGFGLQNIVNNFVSGIILLIERPIKVGDWVVVGGMEGYVRRINVRATEIETFPRASVIIPNSELVAQKVVNWTYRNKIGRVEVTIGVGYGSDVDRVRDVLLQVMAEHPAVDIEPAPFVLFMDFADSALTFSARGFISDVERRGLVESELRFAIYRKFGELGIEIPYPQRVVHVKGDGGQSSNSATTGAW